MQLARDIIPGITRFLALVPAETRRRGQQYHANGQVIALDCVRPNKSYVAVVQGQEAYDVALKITGKVWTSQCSCPMGYDCKHAVAAMLELQQGVLAEAEPTPIRVAPARNGSAPPAAKAARGVKQPPSSPVYEHLVKHLGRALTQPEADFIRRVQTLHTNASFRSLTENDLGQVGQGRNFYHWQPLELWPALPPDDYFLWLYVAWELRRRGATFPGFMDGITDFSLIEAELQEWERAKQVAHWKGWFSRFDGLGMAADPGTLELRLVLHPAEARLQWRTQADAAYADFKQAHAKKFAEQFERVFAC